jgi:hypothetical protein
METVQIGRFSDRPERRFGMPGVGDYVALVVVEWKDPRATLASRPQRFTRAEFVAQGRTFGAYLLVGPEAVPELVAQARRVLDTLHVDGPRLERNGVSLVIPAGWDDRVLFRDPAGSSGTILQVANFELPPNEGLEPPRELPPGQEDPIKAMGAGDILLAIVSDEAGGRPAPHTITLDDLRFLPPGAPRVPRGHALAKGSFCFGVRCLLIEADFGGKTPAAVMRSRVNEVIASLAVVPTDEKSEDDGPRGCPRRNWPGPWTACAEADWVRSVVEASGYRVVGETGSALTAEGKGRSFNIWTTRAVRTAKAIAAGEGFSHLRVVDGVSVFGDAHLWRFWDAQG